MPGSGWWQRFGALLLGPLLAGGTVVAIEIADSFGIKIPNPPSLLVMIVVFSAFSGGLKSGLLSYAIACIYFALYYSTPHRPLHYDQDNLLRVLAYAMTTPAMVVMASIAKRRADRLAEAVAADASASTRRRCVALLLRAAKDRAEAAPGEGGGRGGEPRQERVPRQHEPRDPHADERHHRA